jgi:hypothetical protein
MKINIIFHKFSRIYLEEKRSVPAHAPDTQFLLLQSVTLAHFPPTLLTKKIVSNEYFP